MRLALLCALAACGDNALPDGQPLQPANDLTIVAHQDDDLIFMQPDLFELARAGTGLTTVYITAGNGTHGPDLAEQRYAGLRAAYSYATGARAWQCGWIEIEDHVAQHCRLDAANLSLVFLAYPDGGEEGEYANSLLHLWEGTIAGASTISERPTRYDRDSLIDTVTGIVRATQPTTIRTLEVASTHGRDHSDHMIAAAIAVLASARADSNAELRSYRGYNMADEPDNKDPAIYREVFPSLARYEACATGCADCGEACSESSIKPVHVTWLHRRYAVGFRRAVRGQLRANGQCILATGVLGDCAGAPIWTLDDAGELHSADVCLAVSDSGDLAGTTCIGGPDHRFFVDDEGHVWSGVPPEPQPAMDYAHLQCLDGAHASLCGDGHSPALDIVPALVSTPSTAIDLGATGRAVRIGDLTGDGRGDLCAVTARGLLCAAGDGAGGFARATRIDDLAKPLAIDPQSLVLGDVDSDGKTDACGRALDGSGLLCATAADFYAARPRSAAFGIDAVDGTSQSLAVVDTGFACGLSGPGVICQPPGATLDPIVLSPWPDPSALVFPAELDGDGAPDWCAATATGAACAVGAESHTSTDGVPWSFSLAGTPDPAPADAATGALADVDGDGRADLCMLDGARVACARGQGRGFGPRATFVPLPAPATALWLGDLDGDGHADACVDTGTGVTCALSP